jgi:SAM-dependent methyltransferase
MEMADPSDWVVRFAPLIATGGAILDLACGTGRHARYFHQRGHKVTAIDRSIDPALAALGIDTVEADLEAGAWPLSGRVFAGIIVTNYLHRPLLPVLAMALEPAGGILLYETFAAGQAQFGRPSNPDFLLRPNELVDAFAPKLTILAYEHGIVAQPRPAARQRLAAIAGQDLAVLPSHR